MEESHPRGSWKNVSAWQKVTVQRKKKKKEKERSREGEEGTSWNLVIRVNLVIHWRHWRFALIFYLSKEVIWEEEDPLTLIDNLIQVLEIQNGFSMWVILLRRRRKKKRRRKRERNRGGQPLPSHWVHHLASCQFKYIFQTWYEQ